MLRKIKLSVLDQFERFGVNRLVADSQWRRERLLILCYHAISIDDEDRWNGQLYIPRQLFRHRLEELKRLRANVMDLGEGLKALSEGTLPPRAVAITFDDGGYDFYCNAWPMLREFGFPATLYYTTYYAQFNRMVFDPATSYLLWKSPKRELLWPEVTGNEPIALDEQGRKKAWYRILNYSRKGKLSGEDKDQLLTEEARRLDVDIAAIRANRLFHLMTLEEGAAVAAEGCDIQLHTHRHRVSRDPALFRREIEDNRSWLRKVTDRPTVHFCYPGGFHLATFPEWLRGLGVRSTTTCLPGLATRGHDMQLLPRFLDTVTKTRAEFAAWVSGSASIFPASTAGSMAAGQLMEESLPEL